MTVQQHSENEWIEWAGGECPVPADTIVQTQYRNGRRGFPKAAGSRGIDWASTHSNDGWDFIAYRVVSA